MRRGFGLIELVIVLAAATAFLAMLYGLYRAIDSRAFSRGKLEVRAQWEAANRKAQMQQMEREARVAKSLLLADKRAVAADQKAIEYETKWKEARRASGPLAVCRSTAAVAADRGSAGPDPVGSGLRLSPGGGVADAGDVRLTPEFMRLYDSAWTKPSGEPVFRAESWNPGAAGAGAAVQDMLDVHAENAKRCSADRRALQTLLERLKAAEAAWN